MKVETHGTRSLGFQVRPERRLRCRGKPVKLLHDSRLLSLALIASSSTDPLRHEPTRVVCRDPRVMDSIQCDAGLDGIYVARAELAEFEIGGDDGTLEATAGLIISATHLRLPKSVLPYEPPIPAVYSRNRPVM
jgi:hypothetical protein